MTLPVPRKLYLALVLILTVAAIGVGAGVRDSGVDAPTAVAAGAAGALPTDFLSDWEKTQTAKPASTETVTPTLSRRATSSRQGQIPTTKQRTTTPSSPTSSSRRSPSSSTSRTSRKTSTRSKGSSAQIIQPVVSARSDRDTINTRTPDGIQRTDGGRSRRATHAALDDTTALTEVGTLSERALTAQDGGSTGSEATDRLVLIGTVDGHLHAIDTLTGNRKWTVEGAPLLTTSESDGECAFFPDLSDGTLYYTDRHTNEVHRLSKTVQELASGPAILAADGNMYIGFKKSTVYAVDPETGAARGRFLATADDVQHAGDESLDGAILIGRTEYTLVVRRADTGSVAWNMTMAEYSSPLLGHGALQSPPSIGGGSFVIEADDTGRGSIMRYVASTPDSDSDSDAATNDTTDGDEGPPGVGGSEATILWEQRFGTRAVSMYGATTRGGFRKLPFVLGENSASRLEDGSSGPSLIDVVQTHAGHMFAVTSDAANQNPNSGSQGMLTSPDASSVSVYHPAVNQFEVSAVPLIVGPEPHQLLTIGATGPDESGSDTDMEFAPTDPADTVGGPAYMQLALTVVVTMVLSVSVSWVVLQRAPPLPRSAPTSPGKTVTHAADTTADPSGAQRTPTDDSTHASKSPSLTESDGADGQSGSGAAVATSLAEVPIADGEAGAIRLGKIDVYLNRLLGRGSMGTLVYKGRYDGHDIAVKRMLKAYYELAMHEVDLLRRSDDHPNVIRYFAKEEGPEFLYIGLELCVGTLVHVVEGPDSATGPSPGDGGLSPDVMAQLDRKRLAREMLQGLMHLHALQVVHRDLKPQNVLLTHRLTVVISDFGLCKALHDGQSSFHTERVGTQGWVAPELLKKNGGRITRAIDVFSAGCIVHYLFSGKHPFGEYYEREKNIRSRKTTIATGDVLIDSLVQLMIRPKPDRRVSIDRALAHPFFWPLSKRLTFLMDTSDRLETETEGSSLLERFEQDSARALGGSDWTANVGEEFRQDLRRFRTYHADRVVDLLRAIRNKRHHYGELPPELKAVLGSVPDGYMTYFHTRYPQLMLHVYRFITTTDCANEPLFAPYFETG
eukprot:m.10268 g.10268  ORF g.10268 m.10268 type:complete len:1073 (-) comp2732_c0_seq1:177-3395(-)